ncbi:MAG TPA: zf-HC2 domain-containing protein [Candidatus Binatia bacterium]
MNCEEVQSQLFTYLDRTLDRRDIQRIQQHLAVCLGCRTESEEITECIRYVGSLPLIDPPMAFAQRVMARAREIETRPRLWERLFFHWRASIPLQAAAALVVSGLAVYLVQVQKEPIDQPQIATVSPIPHPQTNPSQLSTELLENRLPAKDSATPDTNQGRIASGAGVSRKTAERSAPARQVAQAPKPAETGEVALQTPENRFAIEPSTKITEIPVIRNTIGGGPTMSSTPVSATGRSGTRVWHLSEPESGVIEPFANYELIFKPRVRAREVGRNSIEGSTGANVGLVPGSDNLDALLESALDKSGSAVWLTVPKNEYEQLKRDLRARGAIEQETEFPLFRNDGSSEDSGRYQIKVTVVPPNANRQ